jgi:Zn-dependent protease with chaperone function
MMSKTTLKKHTQSISRSRVEEQVSSSGAYNLVGEQPRPRSSTPPELERRRVYLWPIIAILVTVIIYLTLVANIYKLLHVFPFAEKFLWQSLVSKSIHTIDYKSDKIDSLQNIINNLPPHLLPKRYPKIKLLISKDEEINAFSAPEGNIILTTGLINSIGSETDLLFIVGHEIGHLVRKDHLYQLSRLIISETYRMITWSSLGAELLMLIDRSKSQKAEFLADEHAIKILLDQKHNIKNINKLLEALKNKDKRNNNSIISLTHPDINQRLEKLNLLIEKYS